MKKKILLISVMVMLFATLFAIGASAAIVRHETDPGLNCDDSAVTILDYDAFNNSTATDKESKTVLTDGTYFYVVPSYYVFTTDYYFKPTLTNINAAMKAADATITADLFTNAKVNYVRIELPTWVSDITQSAGKLENWTGIKEFRFGTTLKKISALNAFTGCSNLEAISDISHFTELGNAAFSGCGKLTGHINWPAAVTSITGSAFSNTNITSITIPEGVKSIGHFAFNNCDFTEVILPNSVASIGKGAFSGCKSMTTFSFGANFTTLSRVNADYETFYDCDALKYVYMPAGFLKAVTNASANDYKHIFNGIDSKVTFFFTGTKDEADEIVRLMALTGQNPTLGNAIVEAYNENTNYTNYGTTKNSNVIVYGYNLCDAFYNSNHEIKVAEGNECCGICENCKVKQMLPENEQVHKNVWIFNGGEDVSFTVAFVASCECKYCGKVEKTENIGAILTTDGYSVENGGTGVYQQTKINKTELQKYTDITGEEFDYGIFAGIATLDEGKPLSKGENGIEPSGKTVFASFANTEYTLLQIKVTGLVDGAQIYCGAYIMIGEDIVYLSDKTEAKFAKMYTATIVSE